MVSILYTVQDVLNIVSEAMEESMPKCLKSPDWA